ncbi:DUF7935 family protein [Daejeonella lutea]|uniref:Uncharacterized protein n=1 Tax=Daejeonella lutea TaxID=572036 RepID=A0A1T5FEY1_9SPHI|nr:hypothetical protein [Daejeonella lutea]SKB94754.1 hypothetical protein SAMN05661099_3647 [Daejeonella lutea]
MNSIAYLLEIVEIAVAGVIVFFVGWVFVKAYLDQRFNFRMIEFKKESLKQTLPLRLQAYERTVLFLERINPSNMLIRLHVAGMSAKEMQNLIISDIRAEYQHNISQQLYVSSTTWNVVKKIKDDTISIVNSAVKALPDSATSGDLSKSILLHLAGLDTENPYEIALNIVKKDVQALF